MQAIKVGDPYPFIPSAFISTDKAEKAWEQKLPRKLQGRVIYIHPEGRFITVEAELHGSKIRESFKIH